NHPNLAGQSWVVKKYAEHFEQFRADLNVQVVDVIVRQGVATVYTIRSGVIHSSEGGDAIREVHDMVVYTLRNDGVFGKWRIVARLSKGLEEGGV
ncbi:MAG: hypothetical protein OER43_19370, partial [Gammaproteobacteria bacterium]|nr:hypothetical protein [Gammaproteobacteria bacterium]